LVAFFLVAAFFLAGADLVAAFFVAFFLATSRASHRGQVGGRSAAGYRGVCSGKVVPLSTHDSPQSGLGGTLFGHSHDLVRSTASKGCGVANHPTRFMELCKTFHRMNRSAP
jgi:hypothetical protein